MSGYTPGTPEYRDHIRAMVDRSQMTPAQRDQDEMRELFARAARHVAVGPFTVPDGGPS